MNSMLTKGELDAVSAWWITGSVVAAAALLGVSRSTVKNQLYMARLRTGSAGNTVLVQKHIRQLRSVDQLQKSHNQRQAAAV